MLNETGDVNVLFNRWTNLFSLIVNKHAPLTEICVSEKYCSWIDKGLQILMQTRDRLKKAAIKRKSSFLMDSYRQIRNRVTTLSKQLKKQYYTNKVSACKGNMKVSWKTINELLI